jgi:hypothetical protein
MRNFLLNKLGFVSVIVLILIISSSCSSLLHWKKREVMVESFPQGASVYYDNNLVGQTPCAVKIKNKPLKKQTIKIEKENYTPTNIKLKRKIHGSFWLNGLFVFVFSPIDFVTGRIFKYDALEAKVLKPIQGFYSPYDSIPNLKSLTIWDEEMKLSKGHFQGKIPKDKSVDGGSSTAAAAIVSYFICKYKISENKIDVYSFAVMDKKLTWKRKGGLSNELLAHEKSHFDISEIYSRKLKKHIKGLKINNSNCTETIKAAYEKYWGLMRAAQVKYDKETAHSINEETQKLWELKIKEELDSTHLFGSPRIEINF